jgi:hypothetical protein
MDTTVDMEVMAEVSLSLEEVVTTLPTMDTTQVIIDALT